MIHYIVLKTRWQELFTIEINLQGVWSVCAGSAHCTAVSILSNIHDDSRAGLRLVLDIMLIRMLNVQA